MDGIGGYIKNAIYRAVMAENALYSTETHILNVHMVKLVITKSGFQCLHL